MDQKMIELYMAVVEEKSISGAARALYYSQSVASERLSQLERELGVRLVMRERGIRQVWLTPAGEAFVPLARRWLELSEQVEYYIQAQRTNAICDASKDSAD